MEIDFMTDQVNHFHKAKAACPRTLAHGVGFNGPLYPTQTWDGS